MHRYHGELSVTTDLESEDRQLGFCGELATPGEEITDVGVLLRADLSGMRPRLLPPVVGTRGLSRAIDGRPVKQEDEVVDMMRVDEETALRSQLTRADEFTAARRERAAAARHVKPIVLPDAERSREKCIRRFLETAVRARDDEDMRPLWIPLHSEFDRFHGGR